MIELKYTQRDDYLLSEMGLNIEDKTPFSKYGKIRYHYLEKHRLGLFTMLLLNGELMPLHEVDQTAE